MKSQDVVGPQSKIRPFISLYDRHRYVARVDKSIIQSDPNYYLPLVKPGEEGKKAYIAAMGGTYGCGTKLQPSDSEIAAFICDVALDQDVDRIVALHCDQCFKCQLLLVRMLYHVTSDRPGSEWSPEIAAEYPMLVKAWENDKYHFRVFYKSIKNGPSFHIYEKPFSKDKRQLIIGSSAGVFGVENYPLKDFVRSTHAAMVEKAKTEANFTQKLDPTLIAEFARRLGMEIEGELRDFLAGKTS